MIKNIYEAICIGLLFILVGMFVIALTTVSPVVFTGLLIKYIICDVLFKRYIQ